MEDSYCFDPTDIEVVRITQNLIAKIMRSELVDYRQRVALGSAMALLSDMPDIVHDPTSISISLIGPRRRFGDHEIYHFWTIEIEQCDVEVRAGGHFYRPSTGGDSFTSFRWFASPGYSTDCEDFSQNLRIVDDAQPFGTEVAAIDLSDPGYSIEIEVDGEVFERLDDHQEDDQEDSAEDQPADTPNSCNANDVALDEYQLCVCLWGFMESGTLMIYAIGGRVYALSGDDEEILQTLEHLSRHDYRLARRVRVPARFSVVAQDGSRRVGYAAPSTLNDPNARLFDELLNELENSLPPLPDFVNGKTIKQFLGEDPLFCRTLLYEDAKGDCLPIVDSIDFEWLRAQIGDRGPLQ